MANKIIRNFHRTFATLAAAGRVAAAVEARRAPKAHDLAELGIDPGTFKRMGL